MTKTTQRTDPQPSASFCEILSLTKAALLIVAVLLAARVAGAASPTDSRPNILIIVSDDQGYGDFSCFGNPRLQTPNLDRLKAEGVWLERFYVSPLCAPTRAALLTGRHQFRTGVWDTWGARSNLPADETTLAKHLAQAGYVTGQFGKWHLGTTYPFRPQDHGFAVTANTYYPLYHDRLNPRFEMNGVVGEPRGKFLDDVIADEAIRFMGEVRSRPFFAYVAFYLPHSYTGKQVPDEYVRPYEKDQELLSGDREVYGMVANLDQNVGRLLGALRERGLAENTLVVFLSDNGPAFASPTSRRPGSIRYNFGLRAGKGTVYEGGIRVPAFIRWPGRIVPGILATPLMVQDVLPTVLEAAGQPTGNPTTVDGRSFLPLLTRGATPAGGRYILQQQQPQRSGRDPQLFENACVIGDRYKLVFPRVGVPPELYDLLADRGETRDIAAAKPTLVADMKAAYVDWFSSMQRERGFRPARTIIGTDAQPELDVSASWVDSRYGFPLEVSRAGVYRVELRSLRSPERRVALRDVVTGRVWPLEPVSGVEATAAAEMRWRAGEKVDLQPVYMISPPSARPEAGNRLEPMIGDVPLGTDTHPFSTLTIRRDPSQL